MYYHLYYPNGELFFCHAGLTTKHLELLKKYGKDISYINRIWKNFVLHGNVLKEDKELFDNILLDYNGILWTRELDNQNDLNELLKSINCTFMFVGHTVMDGIKFYNNKVWYTDTGISRAFGNNKYQYILINHR